MAHGVLERRVEAARRFNRFYTRRIGVLHDGVYDSSFSLTQVRVLYELAHRDRPTATALGRDLGLDAGYLSRLLRGFEKRGLVTRTRSPRDGRQSHLALTAHGRKVFAPLNARSHDDVAAMLGGLSPAAQARATEAMQTIEQLLGDPPAAPAVRASYVLREPRPGDLGWVVHRHGAVYALEYGYDQTFEALVAEIVAHFVRSYDPKRERCWIAEQALHDLAVGPRQLEHAIEPEFMELPPELLQTSMRVHLKYFSLLDPKAGKLTNRFVVISNMVTADGGKEIVAGNERVLRSQERLYAAAGFRVVRKDRNRSFGKALVSETWELKL